jgi:hypothetical protein
MHEIEVSTLQKVEDPRYCYMRVILQADCVISCPDWTGE